MHAVWYAILAAMLTTWVVLDGFDLGAGIVQRIVARTDDERGMVLAAIAPVWDGNEVWLVASGGVFVYAFPRAYAVALSGMYLPLCMVLWLLVFRGISIELRAQVAHPLWRAGWDGMFTLASTVLAFVAGVALGNVIRGVPIDETGWFETDLFALGTGRVGAIDAYTGLVGLFAIVLLAAHGASYLAWKTDGALRERCTATARRAWVVGLVLAAGTTFATALVRPRLFVALAHRPWVWPLALAALASPVVALRALARRADRRAFLASSAFVASLLLVTAGVLYPLLLPSTVAPIYDLDVDAAASGHHGLVVGIVWWSVAIALAVVYFANLFRSSRGRVKTSEYGH
jgi:cytochrome d ubiquinol oxidase subunit II